MRCTLATCAASAVVDQFTNRLSLFNLIDGLDEIIQFPTILSTITAVFILERDEGDSASLDAVLIFSQENKELFRNPVAIAFTDKPRLRVLSTIQGLLIPAAGT